MNLSDKGVKPAGVLLGLVSMVFLGYLSYFFVAILDFTYAGSEMVISAAPFSIDLNQHRYLSNSSASLFAFPSSASLGNWYELTPEGFEGYFFTLDSSFGLFNGAVTADRRKMYILSGQGCTPASVTSGDPPMGVESSLCQSPSASEAPQELVCESYCSVPKVSLNGTTYTAASPQDLGAFFGINQELFSEFEIAEFYRAKNALGFGYTKARQRVAAASVGSPNTIAIEIRASATKASNSSVWQDIVLVYCAFSILLNLLVRFIATKFIVTGVKLKKSRYNLYSDLAGGLITSPGVSMAVALMVTVITLPDAVWVEAALLYKTTWNIEVALTLAIASSTRLILSFVLAGSARKLNLSGSLLFVCAYLARLVTKTGTRLALQDYVRGLGMTLIRPTPCRISSGTGEAVQHATVVVDVNVADGVGVSGLEVLAVGYTEPILYSLALALALEAVLQVVASARGRHLHVSPSTQKPSSQHKISLGGSRSSEKSSQPKYSSYLTSLQLSGYSHSHFCKSWTTPLETPFGQFFTLSTMLEDNHVLWGPLLLPMSTYPVALLGGLVFGDESVACFLVRRRWYTGVVTVNYHVACRVVQKDVVPDYLYAYYGSNAPLPSGTQENDTDVSTSTYVSTTTESLQPVSRKKSASQTPGSNTTRSRMMNPMPLF